MPSDKHTERLGRDSKRRKRRAARRETRAADQPVPSGDGGKTVKRSLVMEDSGVADTGRRARGRARGRRKEEEEEDGDEDKEMEMG